MLLFKWLAKSSLFFLFCFLQNCKKVGDFGFSEACMFFFCFSIQKTAASLGIEKVNDIRATSEMNGKNCTESNFRCNNGLWTFLFY